jgi:hypothetical protein
MAGVKLGSMSKGALGSLGLKEKIYTPPKDTHLGGGFTGSQSEIFFLFGGSSLSTREVRDLIALSKDDRLEEAPESGFT